MERKWKSAKYPGIEYRLHPTRKHGVKPDRYYRIRYRRPGEDRVTEGLGWSTEGWTVEKAASVLATLKANVKTGEGPQSLKEKRKQADDVRREEERQAVTFKQFWESDYVNALMVRVSKSSSEKEISQYNKWLGPALGHLLVRDIAEADLERLHDRMRINGLSPRSIQYILGTFQRIWKHALRRKLVTGECPAARLELPKVNNARLRALTPEEARAILEALAERDPNAFDVTFFCLLTGCRASEAFRLTWEHVDFVRETATFPKTKNRDVREVFLSPDVVDMLKARGPGAVGQHVFTGMSGQPYKQAPAAFFAVVKSLGLNQGREPRDFVCFHTLRHTAATYAARRGINVKDFQIAFGWKTPSMVFRYVKGNEDEQRRAMAGLAQALKKQPGKVVDIRRAVHDN